MLTCIEREKIQKKSGAGHDEDASELCVLKSQRNWAPAVFSYCLSSLWGSVEHMQIYSIPGASQVGLTGNLHY